MILKELLQKYAGVTQEKEDRNSGGKKRKSGRVRKSAVAKKKKLKVTADDS